jgi:hypothetical protein
MYICHHIYKKLKHMKNLFISLAVAAMFSFVACGPSQADLEQKRIQDSIKMADSIRVADSIAAAAEQSKLDSIAKADSVAKADSIAKAGKK